MAIKRIIEKTSVSSYMRGKLPLSKLQKYFMDLVIVFQIRKGLKPEIKVGLGVGKALVTRKRRFLDHHGNNRQTSLQRLRLHYQCND